MNSLCSVHIQMSVELKNRVRLRQSSGPTASVRVLFLIPYLNRVAAVDSRHTDQELHSLSLILIFVTSQQGFLCRYCRLDLFKCVEQTSTGSSAGVPRFVLPLSECGVAALPARWIDVVVVDVLLGGRSCRGRASAAAPSAGAAAAAASTGLVHLRRLALVRVRHRGAVGQVGVLSVGSGVQLRSHLPLLFLVARRQRQSQDLIT